MLGGVPFPSPIDFAQRTPSMQGLLREHIEELRTAVAKEQKGLAFLATTLHQRVMRHQMCTSVILLHLCEVCQVITVFRKITRICRH